MARLLIYVLVVCVIFVLYVRYLEKNALFFPEQAITVTPQDGGMAYEDVYLVTQDNVKIHGWYIPAKPEAATLLYLHGNAGNISDRVHKLGVLHAMGLNIFIIDYRGYGMSEGAPSEEGITLDALAAYDYLLEERGANPGKVIVYGASLGGVPACRLVAERKTGALIIDSSFTSAVDMAKVIYPFVPSFMVTIKLDNASVLGASSVPKLIMHSKTDEVVPYFLGKKLFDVAAEPKQFLDLTGTHMNSHLEDGINYTEGIEAFLTKYQLL